VAVICRFSLHRLPSLRRPSRHLPKRLVTPSSCARCIQQRIRLIGTARDMLALPHTGYTLDSPYVCVPHI